MSLREEETKSLPVVLWEEERKGDVLRAGGPRAQSLLGLSGLRHGMSQKGLVKPVLYWGKGWPGLSGERPEPLLGDMGHWAV